MRKLKVVITGPESTGKSTLCQNLSKHFNCPFSKEYAREYLNTNGLKYTAEEVEIMGFQQVKNNSSLSGELVFCDTDALTYSIWYEVTYGKKSALLQKLWKDNLPDLYLLTQIDLPWEEDEMREHPHQREFLFDFYTRRLAEVDVPVVIIEGVENNQRLFSAIKKVETHLGSF